jgi:hypothetical protein
MFARWVERVSVEIASGCIYISGAVEYDDRPGPIREKLVEMVQAWQSALLRCVRQAVETGDLKQDTDPEQMVYEMYGLILALHHDARFLKHPRQRGPRAPRLRPPACRLPHYPHRLCPASRSIKNHIRRNHMGQYAAPMRDMQFVLHELLKVEDELKQLPKHAEVDADIINQVLEEPASSRSEVTVPAEPQRRPRRLPARRQP